MGEEANERPRWRRQAVVLAVVALMVGLGLFAKHAFTRFANMGLHGKRAEGIWRLEQIHQAQLAYFEKHGEYVAVGATPQRAPGGTQAPFESEHMAGWKRLGWQPDSMVRCQYEVTVPTPSDFRAVARCDVDDDGQMAVFISTRAQPSQRISPDKYY